MILSYQSSVFNHCIFIVTLFKDTASQGMDKKVIHKILIRFMMDGFVINMVVSLQHSRKTGFTYNERVRPSYLRFDINEDS